MYAPRSPLRSILVCFVTALTITSTGVIAQPLDTIRASPNAVALRSIWSLNGANGAEVGIIVAALGDIDGNGRAEFGVASSGDLSWRIYGLDSLARHSVLWEYPAADYKAIAVGHLTGSSRLTLVYPRQTSDRQNQFIDFFAIDSGRIADTVRMTWSSRKADRYFPLQHFHLADLDLDGDDELIITAADVLRGGTYNRNGEIWIYAGGPDFQVDTPTVVIRDDKHHGNEYTLHIGRVDADEYPDLVCVTFTGGRIRWGGPDVTALDRPVDREFAIAESYLRLLDADGDSRADFLWRLAYMHLSSAAKDPRTRGFDQLDADRHFVGRGTRTLVLGPLNDSADRYDMFGLNSALGDGVELVFSGGHSGPDALYDATYRTTMRMRTPAGDIDGNGWRDFLGGNEQSGDGGLAIIYGGGPYIPRDSMPASAIRDITIDGRQAAVTVWPNPASEVVHIAWRGDLARTPATFTVHNALGRLVARGNAEGARGEVVWRCAERPAGVYCLSIYDRAAALMTTSFVLKR